MRRLLLDDTSSRRPADCATYINTGTSADVIRVPRACVEEGADDALESFLRDLRRDVRAPLAPTSGDIRLDADGRVVSARLRSCPP